MVLFHTYYPQTFACSRYKADTRSTQCIWKALVFYFFLIALDQRSAHLRAIMIFMFFASLLAGLLFSALAINRRKSIAGKHVVISGGSSGIGKSLAECCIKEGAVVTIIARNEERLKQTCDELENATTGAKVSYVAVDLSSDYETVRKAIAREIVQTGDVDILVNCAGTAVARTFEDTTEDDFRNMMESNYFSSVNLTKACLPSIKKQASSTKDCTILFTSSVAGLFGLFGYTAYSPSKFALVGLAQSLRMELSHLGINVMTAFPPDTDTPGFAEENKGKPEETRLISESGGLIQPTRVAKQMLHDILINRVVSSVGQEGMFLTTASSGLWPISSASKLISEVLLLGPIRLIFSVLMFRFYKIVSKCHKNKTKTS